MKEIADLIRAGLASDTELALIGDASVDEVRSIKSESVPNCRFFLDETPAVDRQVIYRDAYGTDEEFEQVRKLVENKRMSLNDVISAESVDRYSSIVRQRGLRTKNYRKNPQVLWSHDQEALPIARAHAVRRGKNRDGVSTTLADTEFYSEDLNPHAEIVRRMVFARALPGRSIMWIPLKTSFPDEAERKKLGMSSPYSAIHEESELLEYSVVVIPGQADAAQERAIKRATDLRKRILEEGEFSQTVVDSVFNATPITEQDADELVRARMRSFIDFGGLGNRMRDIYEEREAPAPTVETADPDHGDMNEPQVDESIVAEVRNQNTLILERLGALEDRLASLPHASPERDEDHSSDADDKSRNADPQGTYAALMSLDPDELARQLRHKLQRSE